MSKRDLGAGVLTAGVIAAIAFTMTADPGSTLWNAVLVLCGLLALLAVMFVVQVRRLVRDFGEATITPRSEFAMPAVHPRRLLLPPAPAFDGIGAVERLQQLGFTTIGSFDFLMPGHGATFACLLSADRTTMATVTPLHVTFTTDFQGKLLSTANRGTGGVLPYDLQQVLTRAAVETLWNTHVERIGTVVAATALVPVRREPERAFAAMLLIERHGLGTVDGAMMLRSTLGPITRPLAAMLRGRASVERRQLSDWADSSHRWSAAT